MKDTNYYLDIILRRFEANREVFGVTKHHIRALDVNLQQLSNGDYDWMIRYLDEQQYIEKPDSGRVYYVIAPKGRFLLASGGFTAQSKIQKDTLLFAKESRNLAGWGVLLSIVAIIVSVVIANGC